MSEEDLSKYIAFPKTKKEKKVSKPMRRVKKGSRAVLEKSLDVLWSKAVKELAGYECAICGSCQNLNSHHIHTRSIKPVRWDTKNGICLCVGHHKFNNHISAHKASIEFARWYFEKYDGENNEEYLKPIIRANKPFSMEKLQEIKKKLENIISARTK